MEGGEWNRNKGDKAAARSVANNKHAECDTLFSFILYAIYMSMYFLLLLHSLFHLFFLFGMKEKKMKQLPM